MPSCRHTRKSAVRTIRFDNMPTKARTRELKSFCDETFTKRNVRTCHSKGVAAEAAEAAAGASGYVTLETNSHVSEAFRILEAQRAASHIDELVAGFHIRQLRWAHIHQLRWTHPPAPVDSTRTPPPSPPGQAEREEDHAMRALAETARRCAMFVLGDVVWA
jgi:hypothetical protein